MLPCVINSITYRHSGTLLTPEASAVNRIVHAVASLIAVPLAAAVGAGGDEPPADPDPPGSTRPLLKGRDTLTGSVSESGRVVNTGVGYADHGDHGQWSYTKEPARYRV
jgi:hypothetical protein